MGSFPFQQLVDDYKNLGADNFEIKIIDELEIKDETEKELDSELESLEEMWVEKLKQMEWVFIIKIEIKMGVKYSNLSFWAERGI